MVTHSPSGSTVCTQLKGEHVQRKIWWQPIPAKIPCQVTSGYRHTCCPRRLLRAGGSLEPHQDWQKEASRYCLPQKAQKGGAGNFVAAGHTICVHCVQMVTVCCDGCHFLNANYTLVKSWLKFTLLQDKGLAPWPGTPDLGDDDSGSKNHLKSAVEHPACQLPKAW